jgi:phosphotransferase system enzyme I (PtsP)
MDAPRDEGLYLLLLKDTADAVARSATLEAALAATVEMVAKRLGYDVSSIYLRDDATGELVLKATHGLREESVGQVRMPLTEGLTGLVAETETPFFTSRADEHPRFKFFPETGEERFRSFGGVPLVQRGRCIGVLTVQTVREYPFHANEIVVLETLAKQVVSLIDVTRRLAPTAEAKKIAGKKGAPPSRGLLVGLGTSPGVGQGSVVTLGVDQKKAPPAARPFEGEEVEFGRFERARERAAQELDAFAVQLERDHGEVAGKIFRAHEELLRDPGFEKRLRERIVRDHEPVERAVHATIEEYVSLLRSRPSALLRERIHDLFDVRDQLLAALGSGERPGLAATGANQRAAGSAGSGAGVVVLAQFLTPAETAHLDPTHVVAIVTEHGSETSHASILARSLGIPAVVAIPELTATVAAGDRLLVDGDNGYVFRDPDPATEAEYAKRSEAAREAERTVETELAARSEQGPLVSGVQLLANVGLPSELGSARERGAQGIGLLRTEFFFLQQTSWPSVADQVAFYRRAFKAAPAGPIVVRLLDAGGDKELPYVEPRPEPNPILGLRSIRFLLAHPDVLRGQVRALLEAAALESADVRLLIPLVTAAWELAAAREMVLEAGAKFGFAPRPLGMMVEAPSLLYQLDDLVPLSDFVSVGTNDLTQYLLAVDRDNELVRHYYSPYHPAVVRALFALQDGLARRGVDASVCGEMAGDPLGALALLALGYRSLSVRPRAIPALRCLIHCFPEAGLAALREHLLAAGTADEVERVLRRAIRPVAPFLLETG